MSFFAMVFPWGRKIDLILLFQFVFLLLFFLAGLLVTVSAGALFLQKHYTLPHTLIAEIICTIYFITAQAADTGRAGSAVSDIMCGKRK